MLYLLGIYGRGWRGKAALLNSTDNYGEKQGSLKSPN